MSGLRTALTSSLNSYAKKKNLLKIGKEKRISKEVVMKVKLNRTALQEALGLVTIQQLFMPVKI